MATTKTTKTPAKTPARKPAAPKTPAKPERNIPALAAKVIASAFLLAAVVISFSHIIHAAEKLQVTTWQAWTAPFFIDGFMLLGMLGGSARFAESTQRTAAKLRLGAVLASLVANVYAGETVGDRMYGGLIVAGFLTAEWFVSRIKAAPTATEIKAAQLAATRKAAAAQAKATREANAEAAAIRKAEAAERRRLAASLADAEAMARVFDTTVAPVSPAPMSNVLPGHPAAWI